MTGTENKANGGWEFFVRGFLRKENRKTKQKNRQKPKNTKRDKIDRYRLSSIVCWFECGCSFVFEMGSMLQPYDVRSQREKSQTCHLISHICSAYFAVCS